MGESRSWKVRGEVLRVAQGSPLQSSVSPDSLEELIPLLEQQTRLSPLTLRVCVQRGLTTAEQIQNFLAPRFDALKNPMTLQDMDRAVARLAEVRNSGGKIRVFGDYDVDGTTGAALLAWVFKDFGYQNVDVRQPDRFKDGYGLNVQAVEEAVRDQVEVLLTVDCGITSFDAAARAQSLGLSLIIVDHHQVDPAKGIPKAHAVVNPQRADCTSGLKQLCGCGLAFYLAIALRSSGRKEGWFLNQPEPNLKQHLDLVVMATAADMVPLTGDNHILTRYGLQVLKNSKKPGVRALLEAAGLALKDVSPGHLGFVLGPRINASGRMHSASLALDLLTTEDPAKATTLALELEELNRQRAQLQNEIWDQVRARVEEGLAQGKYRHAIAVADSAWHEGVVGIVASRVTEMFRKPAAVIALREDFGKGSVRSFGGKDVLAGLRQCASNLLGFGGHKHAAGLSVALDQFELFERAFDEAFAQVPQDADASCLWIEGECSLGELSLKALEELERLGPFGPGNPEPVFAVEASVSDHRILKDRHLKLSLTDPLESLGLQKMEAIWFNGAEKKEVLQEAVGPEVRQWAGVPELNRFRGRATPTLRIRDSRRVTREKEGGRFDELGRFAESAQEVRSQ
ncbi:MAG: single-stranded-DNA-specific exonuclease RecJ [Bdellovibrionia bacterium]